MDEHAAREARSRARLQTMGLSIADDAPISTPTPNLRTPEEIAARVIVLYVLALRGGFLALQDTEWKFRRFSYRGGLYIVWSDDIEIPEETADAEREDTDPGVELLQKHGLWDVVSPGERQFFMNHDPDIRICVKASWRSECVHVLQWALNLFDEIAPYDSETDMRDITRVFLTTPLHEWDAAFTVRPLSDLLDEFDFVRRCQWLIYSARQQGRKTPSSLNPGVLNERHHALHWVLGIRGEAWDDVTLRT